MANINEEARIPVYINDEQAISALKNLQTEADKWRKKMLEAMAGGDMKGMKEAENEMKKVQRAAEMVKKEAFDVNKVLNNISSASTKDLRKALATVNKEMDGLNRNSKEYQALAAKRSLIKDEFNKINGSIKTQGGLLGNLKSLLPTLGWGAMAAGAVVAFNKIKNSTDTLSTQWQVFVGGLNQATNEFWRTLATGDWSNFIGRMREAIDVGREYEQTLDDLEEKSRALRIIEAEARGKELELEEKLRNKTLSKSERIAAGQERIKLEEDLAVKRTAMQQQAFENEMRITMQESQLSEEQLKTIMADFDSMDKVQAKRYLDTIDNYKKLQTDEQQFREGMARSGANLANPFTDKVTEAKALLDTFPESVKQYAAAVKGQGRTTDEQLNKTTEAWVKLKEAQNSAKENTKRVTTQVNSLLAGEENDGKKIVSAGEKLSNSLLEFLEKDAEAQKDAINKYFDEAGREAFDAFMAAIEQKQGENKIDFTIAASVSSPEEADQADPALDYEVQRMQETVDYQLQLNRYKYEQGLIGEREYQDELTRLSAEADADRLGNLQKYLQAASNVLGIVSSINNAAKDAELKKAGDNAKKREQIEQKYAKKAQKIAIAQAAINGALAVTKILAETPKADFGIMTGILIAAAVATTAAEIAAISGQKFSGGGHTSPGPREKPAGIVHAGEYVIPQEGVNNPQLRPIIDIFELARKNGSLARLDLRPVVASIASQAGSGYASGGGPGYSVRSSGGASSSDGVQISNAELSRFNDLLDRLETWEPYMSVETYEKKREKLKEMTDGGLK